MYQHLKLFATAPVVNNLVISYNYDYMAECLSTVAGYSRVLLYKIDHCAEQFDNIMTV